MKTYFIDSNILLRYVTADDRSQQAKALKLFQRAEKGQIRLVTGPPVFFEVAWTLRSAYEMPREQILQTLLTVMTLRGLKVTDAELVGAALETAFRTGQEFADAYVFELARHEGVDGIVTFNTRDFAKMGAELYPLD
jgi:predicted nucleic acid-binding protein